MDRPNVDFSQLRAFLFCRQVVHEDSGINLIGVHDTRFAKTYPAKFEGLFLYLSFETLRREDVDMELRMRLPSGELRVVARSRTELDESLVVTTEIPFSEVLFEMPGRYSFALYADNKLVGVTPLNVELLQAFYAEPSTRGSGTA